MEQRTQPTLTERVALLEAIVLERGEPVRSGVVGREEYRDEQDNRNRVMSKRIHRDTDKKPPEPTAFEEIINRIQNGTDRVCRISGNLEEIGARIMGQLPESDGANCTSAGISPDGTLDHALLALNWLDGSLARLEAAALRLERV